MLMIDAGSSRSEALEALAFSPEMIERLAPAIRAKREEIAEQLVEAGRLADAVSPEGRAAAAGAALQEAAERAELVEGAKALLANEQGVDVEGLSDERILHAAGIQRQTSLMSLAELDAEHEALAGRWRSLTPLQQAQQAQELDIESASVERYVRVLERDDTPVTAAWAPPVEGAEGADGD
jgi:hypothetical protein